MPIDVDIREHEVLGPMLEAARREGRRQGREEGRQEGRQEGELSILRRLIEKRFGALPSWAAEKLESLSASELEDLSQRVLDAKSFDELLR